MCVPILYLNAKNVYVLFSALLRNALGLLITNVTILQEEASRIAAGVRVKIARVCNGLFLQIPLRK